VSRRLFAVALLPPPALAARVAALRDALDDPRRHDLPPHLTLVPPIDLAPDDAHALRALLRDAAADREPLQLRLGPAASFSPVTETLHLRVDGDLDALHELRDALRRSPVDRPDHHPFVPHVTLLQRTEPERVAAGLATLVGEVGDWDVDRLHLLERLRPPSGAVWHPVAEEPFGGPHVVGRGGVELHLRAISTLEPAAAVLLRGADDDGADPEDGVEGSSDADRADLVLPAGGDLLVVVAEQPGDPTPVAVATGRAGPAGAQLEDLVVEGASRGLGIGRQVLAHWCFAAARRGAGLASAVTTSEDGDGLLGAAGFVRVGRRWCRVLAE
jgi:2'-5' RNA ligase/GNAT superfamily N-acetyltransferase